MKGSLFGFYAELKGQNAMVKVLKRLPNGELFDVANSKAVTILEGIEAVNAEDVEALLAFIITVKTTTIGESVKHVLGFKLQGMRVFQNVAIEGESMDSCPFSLIYNNNK